MPSSDTLPVIFLAFANDHQNYLYKLTEEQNALREALESAESEGLCKVVYETDTDLDKIFKVFNKYKERIAVFHYGGHADDYTLLLKRGDGSRQVAHAGGLVDFLADQKGLQVVFINGCSSRQQAEELRDKGVPAVIGTLEPINDSMATVLSEAFYSALAAGRSLKQAWEGARKRVLAERGSEGYQLGGERSAGRRNAAKTVSFPWELYIRPGSEKVLEWNLPREAQNPLFGLPLPEKYYRRLPASPFLGLHYFKKEDAAIFFGRGAQIRQLYNHILDVHPIILFYGKTGVGKSSLLYAGLLPRIEDQFSVIYVRRNQSLGLTGTLEEALTEGILTGEDNDEKNLRRQQALELLGDIVNKIDDNWVAGQVAELIRSLSAKPGDLHSELPDLLKRWQQLEAFTGKPLIFILDQVEEKYTRPMARQRQVDELVEFLSVIQPLFSGDKAGIRGKLILSYRKEFHPEIRDTFQAMSLPYAEAFLRRLSPEGIAEAVEGITRERNTAAKYRVYIEKGPNGNLPEIIADDLWEDENSSVAPVLQIILKKMWGLAPVNDAGERDFTISLYQNLKKSGLTMAEFFEEQMDILRKKFPEAVESGLALDFLSAHTTAMGTAGRCSKEEVERMYPDRRELIEKLTRECIDLSLLLRMDGDFTILSHDTLAPVVIHEYNLSDKPGQRAARILKNKLLDFNESDPEVFLDEQDLEVVENGKPGMAAFSPAGEKLMAFSRAQSDLRRKKIRRRMLLTLAAVIPLVLIAIFIWLLKLESDSRTRQANFYIAKVFENKALLALDEATQTPSP
ncbi:MAG TPA: AAA family ATPase, partial [Calditrichia bacterium]|nr:AAA family ATPase [Calditrichia bacterium]